MKTLLIYDNGSEGLEFYLFNEDLNRFNGVYINSTGEDIEQELTKFLHGKDHYIAPSSLHKQNKIELPYLIPPYTQENELVIVHCGFLD